MRGQLIDQADVVRLFKRRRMGIDDGGDNSSRLDLAGVDLHRRVGRRRARLLFPHRYPHFDMFHVRLEMRAKQKPFPALVKSDLGTFDLDYSMADD